MSQWYCWRIKSGRHRGLIVLIIVVITVCAYFKLGPEQKRIDQKEINVNRWLENPTTGCDGHFTGYGQEFAWLRYARVDKTRKVFFIPCEGASPEYNFLYGKEGTILSVWLNSLRKYPYLEIKGNDNSVIEQTTFAVMRYEAHNLYHTLCEWYNVYVVSKLLKLEPKTVDILFMDDRPPGLMDDTWNILFGKVTRYEELPVGAVYRNLIWNVIGYESALNFHSLKTIPYVDDFHKFFISSFGIHEPRVLDCKNLHVTVIWRRDYMSHPERKNETGGLIHRKILNEKEVLDIVKFKFRDHQIRDIILENMSMKEQIELISDTDLLIGMHGAGMAHVMFLPAHAAVFETFPNYWGFLQHFKAFSRWRGIKYLGWQNSDPKNEYPNFYTRVPPEVVTSHLEKLKRYLCPS